MSLQHISRVLVRIVLDADRERNTIAAQGGVSAMGNEIEVAPLANNASPLVSVNGADEVLVAE